MPSTSSKGKVVGLSDVDISNRKQRLLTHSLPLACKICPRLMQEGKSINGLMAFGSLKSLHLQTGGTLNI